MDESGVDQFISRSHGWSKRGSPIYGGVSGKRYARESFIAGKTVNGIIAPFCYTGTCNTELFNKWLEVVMIPKLKPGQVIIMDNASFHKSDRTRALIERAGCKILFLPPYSPDLNPIEKFWANFKRRLASTVHEFKSFSEAIDSTFKEYCLN